jgi:hypothetical protein
MELTLDLPVPHAAEVAASRSGSSWSVAELGWKKLLPDLPDDVIELLATPVVVCARSLGGDPEPADPTEEPERYPAPDEPCARTDVRPHFLAPAPPRSHRPRRRA